MTQRTIYRLLVTLAVTALAIYIALPNSPGIHIGSFSLDFNTNFGLDLVGGVQALLEADLPPGTPIDSGAMDTAVTVVENRVNGMGLNDAVVQRAGENRVVVELPRETDPDRRLGTIQQVGMLQFVDMSGIPQEQAAQLVGQTIKTDLSAATGTADEGAAEPAATETPEGQPAATETPGETATATPDVTADLPIFPTVMTGAELKTVTVVKNPTSAFYEISFQLTSKGAATFAEFTASHVGDILAIVVDNKVISIPTISTAITGGEGSISGDFDYESANALAVQLRYGSLPIPLKVVEVRTVGPTLGKDSLQRSLQAGLIGITIVILFMALYYRVPGLAADVAIIIYAIILYAIFRFGVTLTLPGIAGLMLSTGSALDANILIFERMKEEMRAGKTLRQAVDLGWRGAWPSIRDSNVATLLTSAILFWFGNTYGATIVKGFSITLFLGVAVSLFTALVVTRGFIEAIVAYFKSPNLSRWFGI